MTSARPSPSTRRSIVIAAMAFGGVTAIAVLLLIGQHQRSTVPYECGSDRMVALDLSSQNRSDATVETAVDVITAHTLAAAICDESLTVVGVAGGQQMLIDPAPQLRGELKGPNPRARANVVSREANEVRSLVVNELEGAYNAYPDVDTTSVPALFEAVESHLRQGIHSNVVLLTTGVHIDQSLTLNRPLDEGEGSRLAEQLKWPQLDMRTSVAIIGLARMDGDVPVPGDQWPREVTEFNRTACDMTGAGSCELYQVAAIDKALV